VRQDKYTNVLYKGAIARNTEVLNFSWDTGIYLYFTRNTGPSLSQTVLRLNMQEQGAPYFGRN
jgi:hypothetical protein